MAQDNEIDRQYAGTHFSAAAPAEGFEVLLITGMSAVSYTHLTLPTIA